MPDRFILISGLRFGGIDNESIEAQPSETNSLRALLFPPQRFVSRHNIKLQFTRNDLVPEDVLKLIYIIVINILLLGNDERAYVEDFMWTLVKDLHAFEVFPWGTYIYSQSLHYLRLAINNGKLTNEVGKKIKFYGFMWAFQIQSLICYSLRIVLHYIIHCI